MLVKRYEQRLSLENMLKISDIGRCKKPASMRTGDRVLARLRPRCTCQNLFYSGNRTARLRGQFVAE